MCTGRLDLSLILRAFSKGADAVLIAGCHLNECNYITHGNYHALSMTHICKKIMEQLGIDPVRLRMELISGSEGTKFVEVVNDFSKTIRALGPLGQAEGMDPAVLADKLSAVTKIVPYLRLVERERLRIPFGSEESFDQYFASAEFGKLYDELIGDRLAMSQISVLLEKSPLSTKDISEALGLSPSEVARHIGNSTRQRLVRYDAGRKCYELA